MLVCNVLCDDLIRHISSAAAKVAACPHVLSPVVLLDVRELQHDFVRGLPLQPLQQPADDYLRRYRNQKVHVIFRYMSLHDLHVVYPADLADKISDARSCLFHQDRLPVLRRPYQMQVNLVYRVRAASIFCQLGIRLTQVATAELVFAAVSGLG